MKQDANESEIVEVLSPLIEIFDDLGILYFIGGSVASSAYGQRRGTADVDVVADIQVSQAQRLVKLLEHEYYISVDMIKDAIRYRSSFNVIYLSTMTKVDIFIPKPRSFSQQERLRARPMILIAGTRPFLLSSPEDIILNKLEWYRMGGEISTRQWNDILGVLNRQKATLDLAYLRQWAQDLQVSDLLERVVAEAGR